MNVIVNKNDSTYIQNIISKDIICPICNETIFMDIKDYKINLYGCKNNHKNENILLNKFEDSQKKILNDIKCNLCGRNRSNIYNNEFFICITCDKTICPLCRLNHTKEHIIMNYDDKNYICKNHNKSYYKYCNTCKEDMCKSCKNKHRNHDILKFKDKLVKKNDLKKSNKDLKNVLDTFKYKSNIIKEILEKMNNMMDIYYKINNNIINNYNINKMNYYTLLNINKIKNNNEKLIKELNDVINDDKILEYSLNNFYNENGDKYFGDLNNGLKEGKGIYYYKNDERKCYDGDWKNDIIIKMMKENVMMVIGKMITEMEKEYYILMMVINMLVIGKMIKKKEKEYFIGKMEIIMMVIGKIIKKKEKEKCIIIMVLHMKEIGKMINKKEKENIIGI